MNFRILSLKEANDYHHHFTHCLSIGNTRCDDNEHVNGFKGDIKKMKFHDYEFRDDDMDFDRMQKQVSSTDINMTSKCPQYGHIVEMAEWFKNYIEQDNGESRLLIHCYAGISRSSASALLYLLMANGKDIDKAFSDMVKVRPVAFPNRLIIEHIDTYLELGGKLETKLDNYLRDYMDIAEGTIWVPMNSKGDDRVK